jgi:adenylyltransferase/sulfurtransferase
MTSDPSRYSRQIRFAGLGETGQAALGRSRAVIVGLGALGSVSARYLAGAGVGSLRLVDRDIVELGNLHRQILYNEDDARHGLPKAVAAELHLGRVNSEIRLSSHVDDLTPRTADRLLEGADVIVDGTDNFETRFLINEWSIRAGVPWIYGAAVGAYGLTFPIIPGRTGCLACVFETAPPPELTPTCETAGVVGPITGAIASLQAGEALKILGGREESVARVMTVVDLWKGRIHQVEMEGARQENCPVCRQRSFPHLGARAGTGTVSLCGRNAVQVSPLEERSIDLEALARRLRVAGEVIENRFLVRVHVEGYDLTVFADGRSMVKGTDDPAMARSLVSRYLGA